MPAKGGRYFERAGRRRLVFSRKGRKGARTQGVVCFQIPSFSYLLSAVKRHSDGTPIIKSLFGVRLKIPIRGSYLKEFIVMLSH